MDVKSKLIDANLDKKNSTKVVIITSIDDDQVNNPILSCLNPASFQTIMWDLNISDSQRTNNKESVGENFVFKKFSGSFRKSIKRKMRMERSVKRI